MSIRPKILVVCHDAGGAEIISAYINKNIHRYNFVCFTAGPATHIFRKKGIVIQTIKIKRSAIDKILRKNNNARMVLLGSGWGPSLKLISWVVPEARFLGLKTAVYLDHWVSYRERFGYPDSRWRDNLPDEIWVGDSYARQLAKKRFRGIPLVLVPNLYLKEELSRYKLQPPCLSHDSLSVLFVSVPISKSLKGEGKLSFDEFEILELLAKALIAGKKKSVIIIRFHPSEPKDKYDKLLKKYKDKVEIIKSSHVDLVADFRRASVIIGMEGMALVLAYFYKKPVVSFKYFLSQRNILPFPIKRVKNYTQLRKFLKVID